MTIVVRQTVMTATAGADPDFWKRGVLLKKIGVTMEASNTKFIGIWHPKFIRVVPQVEALPW